MSSSAEMASNINEDASSPVDLIQVYPNKSPPGNAKPASKSKNTKKTIPKIAKNINKEKLPTTQMPAINGHQLILEHSLDGSLSPTPVKCIPRLEKSLSSDSYPEMAPDFGVEDGDAQDIANEGCVPVSDGEFSLSLFFSLSSFQCVLRERGWRLQLFFFVFVFYSTAILTKHRGDSTSNLLIVPLVWYIFRWHYQLAICPHCFFYSKNGTIASQSPGSVSKWMRLHN